MKQYCRYCAHAYLQGDEMIWCQQKDEIRTGREITRLNKCPRFELNPIDVLNTGRVYQPRKQYRAADPEEDAVSENQLSLFEED